MAIKKIKASFPETLIKKPTDMHLAKIAHVNKLVDEINKALEDLPEPVMGVGVPNASDETDVVDVVNQLIESLRDANIIDPLN